MGRLQIGVEARVRVVVVDLHGLSRLLGRVRHGGGAAVSVQVQFRLPTTTTRGLLGGRVRTGTLAGRHLWLPRGALVATTLLGALLAAVRLLEIKVRVRAHVLELVHFHALDLVVVPRIVAHFVLDVHGAPAVALLRVHVESTGHGQGDLVDAPVI